MRGGSARGRETTPAQSASARVDAIATVLTRLARSFDVTVRTAVAATPLPENALQPTETRFLADIGNPVVRQRWLRGREALRRLFGDARPAPGSAGSAPASRWSLSHAANCAIAAACAPGTGAIGVDLEALPGPSEHAWKKFLGAAELNRLATRDERERARSATLAWAIKEAAFKATNPNNKLNLIDFILHGHDLSQGNVGLDRAPRSVYRYRAGMAGDTAIAMVLRPAPGAAANPTRVDRA